MKIMWKDDVEANVDDEQVADMEASGWSLIKPKKKAAKKTTKKKVLKKDK